MNGPINCPKCGAKISAGHDRCPRCRADLTPPDPAIATRRSQRLMIVSAVIVVAFASLVFFLWYSGTPSSPSSSSSATAAESTGTGAAANALEPEFLEWSSAPGGSQAELQKRLEEARKIVADSPKNGDALRNLGRLQLQLGNSADAIASFQAAADADPQPWPYRFELAQAQCGVARWDECINTLRDTRNLAPDNVAVTHNLAVALHRRGVDDAAMAEFKKARELNAQQPAPVLGLAVSCDKLGRAADAVEAYQEYLRLAPATPLADKIRTRVSQLGSGG